MQIYVLDTCNVHIYIFKFPSHVLVCVGESFFETVPKNDQNAN